MLGQLYLATAQDAAARGTVRRSSRSIRGHRRADDGGHIFQTEEQPRGSEQALRADLADGLARRGRAPNNLAQFHVDTGGNLDVALQLAQTAKAQLPDMPEVNDTLAWIYYKKDLPRLAVPLLEEAVAKDPNRALYHAHLGMAYHKAGDGAKARASLTQALKLEPNMPEAAEARKILGVS